MRRSFEVREEMCEEVVGVACAGIRVLCRVLRMSKGVVSIVLAIGRRVNVTIGENHYFVDAEDGEGSGYVPCH